VAGLGLPTRLHQQGITEAEIPGLAGRWTGDAPIATNPFAPFLPKGTGNAVFKR
jgi:alcohol dehydrogenase class IV